MAEFVGNPDAFKSSVLVIWRRAHARDERVRHTHAGHFVRHELCVEHTIERPDADDDWHLQSLDSCEKPLEYPRVEHRTGDGELSAGLHLVRETSQLAVEIGGAGVDHHPDVQRRRDTDGLTADVQAMVEARHEIGQPDRINVKYSGRVGNLAEQTHIAGDAEDVSESHG